MRDEKSAYSEFTEVSLDLDSVALARLIEEVRAGEVQPLMGSYNRTYNRHNR